LPEEPIIIDLSARERRLYERLRDRWSQGLNEVVAGGNAPGPGRSPQLGDLVFFLPDLVVLLLRLVRDPRVPLSSKAVALGGVGYVISPIDLMPEILFGPLGLLDDLLVLAAALSRLLNDVHPDVVRAHWPGRGDALVAIQRVTEWAENTVTDRFPRFLRRLLRH
jgi:uncharacterized membrane protein YkvA (DUF1232 family)